MSQRGVLGDVVQFQARTFFTWETDSYVEIDVVRLGEARGLATVEYTSENGSAQAGTNFQAVEGEITFQDHQTEVTINVPIIDTPGWNPTLEFTMRLHSPKGAALGTNLSECRVWIIDKEQFPSSKVQWSHEVQQRFTLLKEYFEHAAKNPIVRKGSIKTFAIDQLPNVLYIVQLALQVQLVDRLLQPISERSNSNEYESPEELAVIGFQAMTIGAMYALPIFIINYLQLSKCWLGVGGAARKQLQVDLLRKYVNLTTQSRNDVGRAGFMEALSRYAYDVVDSGYMVMFDCAKSIGKIVVLLAWSLTVSPLAIPLMCLLPTLLILRVYNQEAVSTKLRLKLFKVQDSVVAHAEDVARNFQMIRDYQRRPLQAQRLERVVQEANFFSNAVWDFDTRTSLLAPTVSVFLAGMLILASPYLIVRGHFSLGEVLVALQAVQSMGDECTILFMSLVKVQHAISALLKVTHLLNLPTDVEDRMQNNRWRRHEGRARRLSVQAAMAHRKSIQRRDISPQAEHRAMTAHRPGRRSVGPYAGTRLSAPEGPERRVSCCTEDVVLHEEGARVQSSGKQQSSIDVLANGCYLLSNGLNDRLTNSFNSRWSSPGHRHQWSPLGHRDDSVHGLRKSWGGDASHHGVRRSMTGKAVLGQLTSKQPYSPLVDEMDGTASPEANANGANANGATAHGVASTRSANLSGSPRFAADMVEIEFRDVMVMHGEEMTGPRSASFHHLNLKVKQGRVVALLGAPSSGKATLLRLIAGVVLPTNGEVFAPPHLNLIHVEQEPQLMGLSLLDNLWFGRKEQLGPDELEWVSTICAAVGLPDNLIAELHTEWAQQGEAAHGTTEQVDDGSGSIAPIDQTMNVDRPWNWQTALEMAQTRDVSALQVKNVRHLPQTAKALIHLARALIAAPEVLLLHRPLALLDDDAASRLLSVLQTFVRQRGLALDPATRASRRLRTVIFSCRSLDQALEAADDVVVVGVPEGKAVAYTAERLRGDPELQASIAASIEKQASVNHRRLSQLTHDSVENRRLSQLGVLDSSPNASNASHPLDGNAVQVAPKGGGQRKSSACGEGQRKSSACGEGRAQEVHSGARAQGAQRGRDGSPLRKWRVLPRPFTCQHRRQTPSQPATPAGNLDA